MYLEFEANWAFCTLIRYLAALVPEHWVVGLVGGQDFCLPRSPDGVHRENTILCAAALPLPPVPGGHTRNHNVQASSFSSRYFFPDLLGNLARVLRIQLQTLRMRSRYVLFPLASGGWTKSKRRAQPLQKRDKPQGGGEVGQGHSVAASETHTETRRHGWEPHSLCPCGHPLAVPQKLCINRFGA